MALLVMSRQELGRLEILQQVIDRRVGVMAAAGLMGLSRRQASRLLKAYVQDGPAGLISKKRSRPSNRRYSDGFRAYVIEIVRANYHDFGPTLAAEKLAERHEITLSKETLRTWMIEAGLWQSRKERKKRVQQPRNRRECFGELIQIDGSLHWWFEDRSPRCSLLVFIDDATSRIVQLRFAPSESTFDYFHAAKAYVKQYGKPLAFYSDKHAIFRTQKAGQKTGNGMTQFGRALNELNIDIICANSPQAKGRVERANKTLQDRLVKELRLQGISTIEGANAFVPEFIETWNAKFAKPPHNELDLHRPLAPHETLDGAMCVKSERTVSNSLTLQYDKVLFILEPNEISAGLARKRVTVCDYPDGRLEIEYRGVNLAYRAFDKHRTVNRAKVVENKRLGETLGIIAAMQAERDEPRNVRSAPRRRGQGPNMFQVQV
ncbi:MAG: ISNCY family transposase [bacterium]|nr:ISNCY family transposase [bacterium]